MFIGIGTPITRYRGGELSDLLQLFRNGENGLLFHPTSDLTRLLLLSDGSTGSATSDADPVGLALDNHSWAGANLSSVVAAQADLVTNGGFGVDANWTKGTGWTISGGKANQSVAPGSLSNLSQNVGLTLGKTYQVTATISGFSAGLLRGNVGLGGSAFTMSANGTYTWYAVATGDTSLYFQAGATFVGSLDDVSVKLVPGNHALQATTTKRPFWKANSGKPYELFDGSDDLLQSPFIPPASVTLACAVRFAASTGLHQIAMGGGVSTGNHRCFIASNATSDKLNVGWGSETLGTLDLGGIITGADHTIVLTGDGTTRDVWVDGSLLDSRAPTGGPDGTGGGVSLGNFNNNGTPEASAFLNGRIYGALALNRRVTAAEIAGITSILRSTYQ